jgi:hypothetical protein
VLLVEVPVDLEHAAVTVERRAQRPMQRRKALAADVDDRAMNLRDRADWGLLWLHGGLLDTGDARRRIGL